VPFDDLFEQARVFEMLDELAKQPNEQAVTDFKNPNYILVRQLLILMAEIQETEKEYGVRPSGSYQFAIVRNLLGALEDCKNAGELKAALPEIKEALLRAWVIQIQLEYGKLVPVADQGKAYLERQKSTGFRRWEVNQEKHGQWRQWQANEKNNCQFAKLSKQAKAAFLKHKHSITDAVPTIAKRLTPLPKKR